MMMMYLLELKDEDRYELVDQKHRSSIQLLNMMIVRRRVLLRMEARSAQGKRMVVRALLALMVLLTMTRRTATASRRCRGTARSTAAT